MTMNTFSETRFLKRLMPFGFITLLTPCAIVVASGAAPQLPSKASGQITKPNAAANPAKACCSVTNIDVASGIVTAKVNSSGQSFQFKVSDTALINSFQSGQTIFANFKTNQVSLDGKTIAGTIFTAGPVDSFRGGAKPEPVGGAKPAGPVDGAKSGNTVLPKPACQITSIDRARGVVTAKVKATGQSFQFKAGDMALFNSFKVGQDIFANFKTRQVSVDGKTPSGSIINLGHLETTLNPGREPAIVPSLTVAPIMMPAPPATCSPVSPVVTVSLNAPAPKGGANIQLNSSNPAVLALPPSVTVPQGELTVQTSGAVKVSTNGATATVNASYGDVNGPASIVTIPPGSPAGVVAKVVLLPSGSSAQAVQGGDTVSGVVELDGFAPPGGLVLTLSSSNPTVATVPTNITAPAGTCSVTFSFPTHAVQSPTSLTISGSTLSSGVGPRATLTVTPGCNSSADCPTGQTCGNGTCLASDSFGKAANAATNVGSVNCGEAPLAIHGTTYPAGTQDWLMFTWSTGSTCSQITLQITSSAPGNILFDVDLTASGPAVACTNGSGNCYLGGRATAVPGVAILEPPRTYGTTSGTYLIRVYGVSPSVTGTWAMTMSLQ